MKRFLLVIPFLFFSLLLHAQTGGGVDNTCTESPENPTAILLLVGIAGAGMAHVRNRIRKK
jgi:XrtJ-associated TM-motif-TM protein